MEKEKVEATVRTIKQSFRLLMNGVTAQSMRDKGVQYKLNWGCLAAPPARDGGRI